MERVIELFHGSPEIVRKPEFGRGRTYNDYGRGFYCTESEELAREWACSSLRDGIANHYRLDLSHLSILDLASEEFTILNWIAVLVSNRVFRPGTPVAGRARRYLEENYMVNVNAYDIVRGYRADDAYYDFADAFLNNAVTVEQLARAMRLGKLGEQIVLKSRLAFERIEFIGYSAADSSYYYPARKVRSEQADQEFRMMSEVLDDGLYMFIASSICRRLENGEPKYLIGMSGIELANRSGVSLRSIQMYEQRNKDINKAQSGFLASISRTLGCRIEDLLEI